MSDNWINNRILVPSDEDGIYDESGTKVHDLLDLDDSVLDETSYPILAGKLDALGVREYEEVTTLTASDAEASDRFGRGTSVYNDRLVVGAPDESTAASNAGKVYVYDWNSSTEEYDEVTTLTASDAEADDFFGSGCAVYSDRLVVGAYAEDTAASNAGKVYVYDWNSSTEEYDEVTTLTASDAEADDFFGTSCAIYGDRLVVGADGKSSGTGKVYVYDWNSSTEEYDEVTTLTASDAVSGNKYGLGVSIYGDRLVVGSWQEDTAASNAGKVYVYDWNSSTEEYDEVTTLTASDAEADDRFGASPAIYGDRLVVGANYEDTAASNAGKVYVYDWNSSTEEYDEVTTLTASDAEADDRFGMSCSLYEDRLVVGSWQEDTAASNAGKVYVYDNYISLTAITSPDDTGLCVYKVIADAT